MTIPTTVHNVRFSRNLMQVSQGSTQYWLIVSGDDVEIDHNTFQHKSTIGNFIEVTGPGDHDMAKRTWIHHNYFLDHSFTGSNGGEAIRVGLSGRQHGSAHALVEYNLFEKCNGDAEVISVKSSDDVIRYNTLLGSTGSIVLRHGNHNLVDGNLMVGGRSGIRFYGNDHTIINNVVQNSAGQAIEVGGGEIRDDTKSTTAHEAADRVLVAFNTLVNDRAPAILVGTSKKFAPSEITFANDLVVGSSGNAVNLRQGSSLHWQGNIIWGVKVGNAPSSGFKTVNPNLVQDSGGLWRLRAGSPAIDAAAGSYAVVTTDVDATARGTAKDVGADEYAESGATHHPLTLADVGPTAP
jgi:poly(beta-D-mannuronate) lyase